MGISFFPTANCLDLSLLNEQERDFKDRDGPLVATYSAVIKELR